MSIQLSKLETMEEIQTALQAVEDRAVYILRVEIRKMLRKWPQYLVGYSSGNGVTSFDLRDSKHSTNYGATKATRYNMVSSGGASYNLEILIASGLISQECYDDLMEFIDGPEAEFNDMFNTDVGDIKSSFYKGPTEPATLVYPDERY